eukprot:TRINITY_DN8807_c0_g1_i1.p3 TRINITY_DN8807_c0_g1~~TRINITY_DN8807_c0_g1_i1.p3  ORF type:complete len:230 (+),score=6.44 TRINITY_DN8807_c0_g1_i1:421-1110(+)
MTGASPSSRRRGACSNAFLVRPSSRRFGKLGGQALHGCFLHQPFRGAALDNGEAKAAQRAHAAGGVELGGGGLLLCRLLLLLHLVLSSGEVAELGIDALEEPLNLAKHCGCVSLGDGRRDKLAKQRDAVLGGLHAQHNGQRLELARLQLMQPIRALEGGGGCSDHGRELLLACDTVLRREVFIRLNRSIRRPSPLPARAAGILTPCPLRAAHTVASCEAPALRLHRGGL